MNKKEIIALLKEQKHEKIKVAIIDIDGIARGKFMSKNKFISALESEFGFCQVLFGWDMSDACYDNVKVTGWHTGYGDMEAKIDPSTIRTIPWEDDIPFFIADFDTAANDKSYVCPRTLLKKVIATAEDMNFKPLFSQEFEWFNYRESSTSLYEKNFQNLNPITSGMFGYSLLKMAENDAYFSDLFDLIQKQSNTSWHELYKVFNCGHRMELYVNPKVADDIIKISKSFNIEAKIIGRVEKSSEKKLTIISKYGEFLYK